MKPISPLLACLIVMLFAGCETVQKTAAVASPPATPPPPTAAPVAGTDLDQANVEKVRASETLKSYPVGRYVDPKDPDVMHEAHVVYRDFRYRTLKFAEAFEGRIASDVSGQEIKEWLNALDIGSRSNKNYLAVVGEVFKYATQKHLVAFSPLDDLTDIDRKELCGSGADAKEPSILTPAEAERLVNAALEHPDLGLLGAVTLALFCGLRTEEIKRLEWAQVRLTESPPVVTIGANIAKKRRIRHIEIPSNAVQWLSLVTDRTGQVTRNDHFNDFQKRFRHLQRFAGFGENDAKREWRSTWENNAMRHSFGSYHYALHGSPLETSRLLGHKASDQVLFDHYRALATKAQAEAYFAICPPATAAKIVSFA